MFKFKKFAKSESAAVLLTVAVSFFMIMAVIGVAIDIARLLAVKNQLQHSLDEALLGAVITADTLDVEIEATMLFYANFPNNYLGSTATVEIEAEVYRPRHLNVGGIDIGGGPANRPELLYTGQFYGTAKAIVPSVIMQIFGITDQEVVAESGVINNLEENQVKAEVALVLDNTGSMTGAKIIALKEAAHVIVQLLFGEKEELENLHISLIPYTTAVVFDPIIFPHARNWVQTAWQPRYDIQVTNLGRGFLSNRDLGNPTDPLIVDASNVAPTTEATKLRTPTDFTGIPGVPYNPEYNELVPGNDIESFANATPLMFAQNVQGPIHARIDQMTADGYTRVNVGALWGWLALSPTWQGIWDPGRPALPRTIDSKTQKYMVLMTDGVNTVFTAPQADIADDDVGLTEICNAAKAMGVVIYSVTLGPSVDAALMQSCATDPSHYFHAPNANQLAAVFEAVAADIKQNFIILNR